MRTPLDTRKWSCLDLFSIKSSIILIYWSFLVPNQPLLGAFLVSNQPLLDIIGKMLSHFPVMPNLEKLRFTDLFPIKVILALKQRRRRRTKIQVFKHKDVVIYL